MCNQSINNLKEEIDGIIKFSQLSDQLSSRTHFWYLPYEIITFSIRLVKKTWVNFIFSKPLKCEDKIISFVRRVSVINLTAVNWCKNWKCCWIKK